MRSFYIAALCGLIALPAYAQTGTFLGTVARDSMDHTVGNAEVAVPQLNLKTTTNYMGEFRIGQIPPGRYAITVKAVGFQPLTDSIDVKAGATVDGDIVLTALPVNLATERTTANAVEKRLPPGLQEMADRMKTHLGGYFVTDSTLRASDEKKLSDLLSRIPGVDLVLATDGTGVFLANSHEHAPPVASIGSTHLPGRPDMDATPVSFPLNKCYVDIFVDGAKFYAGPPSATNQPPNFAAMSAADYSGIEYYSSGATVPPQYNGTSSGCGVMLLWTRRTP
ncbi:MAG TPA: carboxypeptidase-like regulatory domain-containing protein [Gemmatimonadaceae bacterium]|jgi:hypothetical protein